MNPRDWPTAADPLAMLDFLFPPRGLDSVEPQPRASRLYLLACARRAWGRLPGVCRAVAAAAERVYLPRVYDRRLRDLVYPQAEALVHCRGEAGGVNEIGRALVELGLADPADVRAEADHDPAGWAGYAHLVYLPFARTTPHFPRVPADLHSADLVREAFGNPFAPVPPFDRRWATDTVLSLARHAQAIADPGVFPPLADALQDAGCDAPEVLDHLRHGTGHARGCWAVEWVLSGAAVPGAGGPRGGGGGP